MAGQQSPSAERRHPGRVRAWVVWWVLLAALWLLLIDKTQFPELVVGAAGAAIAATGAVLVRGQRDLLLRPRASWLPAALRVVPHLVLDLWPLARALWWRGILRRDERGKLVELEYSAVQREPVDAAHRALTEALGSFGPNTIVVRIDMEHGRLAAHQLVPQSDPEGSAEPLGKGP